MDHHKHVLITPWGHKIGMHASKMYNSKIAGRVEAGEAGEAGQEGQEEEEGEGEEEKDGEDGEG